MYQFGYDMMWGPWSASHWVAFAIVVAIVLYPIGRILARMGFTPYLSLLMLIPMVNLIALWVVAYADWPRRPEGGSAAIGKA